MTYDEYIQQNPHQFKDELDKWLFREFNLLGGVWSSITEREKYSLAREVAEKAMEYAKEQMMKNATDVTVYVDDGGYPYILQIELYDYDNDVPLAEEGDKYKVVLIKEE